LEPFFLFSLRIISKFDMRFSFIQTTFDIHYQRAACEFAGGEFPAVARDPDTNEACTAEIVKNARQPHRVGPFNPEGYGGPGPAYWEQAMGLEEFWKVDPGIGRQLGSINLIAEERLLSGTEEQQKKWLSHLVTRTSPTTRTALR
jgi:alkylation response protein AidB-like acyl-CoA dehydrogenase